MRTISLLALLALFCSGCATDRTTTAEPESNPEPVTEEVAVSEPVRPAVEPELEPEPEPPAPALESFTQSLERTAVTFDMVAVPAGTIVIDGVTHDIPAFWVGRTETTWDLYDVFVYETDKNSEGDVEPEADAVTRPSRPYVAPDRGYGHQGYAAISLAFQGADHYCKWLSAKTGRTYRLPTEAEWRYLCERSGVTPATADAHAWHDGNADFEPHPVGTKAIDAGGLHDLWGNVREWAVGLDGEPIALGGSFMDPPDEIGCAGRHVPTRQWQETDPQLPKSPWWLSDAPFMGCRVVCVPAD